jgi:cytochrome c-type biogenesis protein CcmF
MLSVFLGTLYPLLLDALNLGKISVGAPYFDAVFVPIMVPAVIVMAIAPILRWKKDNKSRLANELTTVCIGAILLLLVSLLLSNNIYILLAYFLFIWTALHSIRLFIQRLSKKGSMSLSFIGMLLAHLGVGVFILGATITSQLGVERDIKMDLNESVNIEGYRFVFRGVEGFSKENYQGNRGIVEVYFEDEKIIILKPEKRQYISGMPMTEAAIDPSLYRDIYVALGESLEGNSWSLRIYYKPLVRCIWLGGILIALGALLAAFDRRYIIRIKP